MARRTRFLYRLLGKCGGIIQLPEGRPGLASEVEPVAQEHAEADAGRKIELRAKVESAGIGRGVRCRSETAAEANEGGKVMPGFSAGHVELHVQIGKDHILLDRPADAIGQGNERINDEPLQASVGYADSNLDRIRRPDVIAAANQRTVMRGDAKVPTVAAKIPADGGEGVPLPDVSVRRGLG